MTQVPTSGSVLEWARTFRGLSEEEAAEKLGISVSDLQEYERGKHPNLTLFERMASRYRLPQATLFLREPPEVPREIVDYRTLGGAVTSERSFDFRTVLSNVRALVHAADRIAEDDEEFEAQPLPRATLSDDPERLGEMERARLGIAVNNQIAWRADQAFAKWRAHLEAQNVLVFQQKFPLADGRGFTLFDSAATPTVVVNKSESADTAKSFTI